MALGRIHKTSRWRQLLYRVPQGTLDHHRTYAMKGACWHPYQRKDQIPIMREQRSYRSDKQPRHGHHLMCL